MTTTSITDMEGFELGKPVLVCRWRLSNCRLPMENRHMRALLGRTVNGEPVGKPLIAWAKQHIEWTLEKGAAENPNGVLLLIIDAEGKAAMAVGPYSPLEDDSLTTLTHRAVRAQQEADQTGVAPETLWLVDGQTFICGVDVHKTPSGATSLVMQLAKTLGFVVKTREDLTKALAEKLIDYTEAFLVSDEHGVVPASDACGPYGKRMRDAYEKLLERTAKS